MKYLVILCALTISFVSCEKAGEGGKSTVIVHGMFENTGTPGAIVYVKFNETAYSPAWSGGDIQDTIDNFSEVELGPFKRGDYYFYSVYTYVNDSGYVDTIRGGKHIYLGTKPSAYHLTIDFSATNPFE